MACMMMYGRCEVPGAARSSEVRVLGARARGRQNVADGQAYREGRGIWARGGGLISHNEIKARSEERRAQLRAATATPLLLSSCANREARGGNFTPPSPPWVQWAAGMGWEWPRGSNLVTGPLGSVAGEPDRRQRQLLCLPPVQAAGAWQVRRRVFSACR
jgi:hypothetical protein